MAGRKRSSQRCMTWTRATKAFRCAVCDHPDWCTYCNELQSWCCMRVQSMRPAKNGGWWHNCVSKPVFVPRPEPKAPEIDAGGLMSDFRSNTRSEQIA